jgi:two-component system sensor kinase FixL
LTERRLAEAAARDKETRLHELERKLSDLSRSSAVGELSAVLAHELNQPLAAIVNYLEAGREAIKSAVGSASASGKADDMIVKALRQANRATEIFHNLRGIGIQDATPRAEEDINDVVGEVSSVGLMDAAKQEVEAQMDLDPLLPEVFINKIQIQQVVLNLLRNGIEAMAGRDTRRIIVTTSPGQAGFVNVSVSDTGSGLADDIRDRLFEPFVSTKPNGMGLGLAISHSIVEAHGGELSAAPNPNGGTIFHMTLPTTAPDGKAHGE